MPYTDRSVHLVIYNSHTKHRSSLILLGTDFEISARPGDIIEKDAGAS